jgi:flavin reductase (DIM6/NTAB) family NADH-FMN oxidoreductase RutF
MRTNCSKIGELEEILIYLPFYYCMIKNEFCSVPILDNFYQTSSYFPMPVVLISTLSPSGKTNLGPYSLCFPYIIAEKHSMLLISRSNSNTAENIRRTKVCAINFIPYNKKLLKDCVLLGYPGETTEEKMKNNKFTLVPSQRTPEEKQNNFIYPEIVDEAIQVFECTLDESFPTYNNEVTLESHFVLNIDKILLKNEWKESLYEGKEFPDLPIDFGYRNNINFWFSKHSAPYAEPIPKEKGNSVNTVIYAAQRIDSEVEWTDEACEKLVKVPRIFLKKALKGCVEIAKKEGIKLITPEFMDKIRDKRAAEKQ